MRPHARYVTDREFLSEVRRLSLVHPYNTTYPGWVFTYDLIHSFPPWEACPPHERSKLIRAKATRVIGRGLMTGCTCGCRGDFELTEKGERLLAT